MGDIVQRVGIECKKEKVFEALASTRFLAAWWFKEGSDELERPISLYCEGSDASLRLTRREENNAIAWQCTSGPQDWVGTTISVSLKYDRGQTFVELKHVGWKRSERSATQYASLWAMCLLSFKSWLENGLDRPLGATTQFTQLSGMFIPAG